MKKLWIILLAALLAFGFGVISCGDGSVPDYSAPPGGGDEGGDEGGELVFFENGEWADDIGDEIKYETGKNELTATGIKFTDQSEVQIGSYGVGSGGESLVVVAGYSKLCFEFDDYGNGAVQIQFKKDKYTDADKIENWDGTFATANVSNNVLTIDLTALDDADDPTLSISTFLFSCYYKPGGGTYPFEIIKIWVE